MAAVKARIPSKGPVGWEDVYFRTVWRGGEGGEDLPVRVPLNPSRDTRNLPVQPGGDSIDEWKT